MVALALAPALAGQPQLVVDLNRQAGAPVSSMPGGFALLPSGDVVFAASTLAQGREPWLVSPIGALRPLADLSPGFSGSQPAHFTAFRGGVLFTAADPGRGAEAWFQPLTGSAVSLGDLHPGVASSEPSGYVVAGTAAYFVADDGRHGRELWVTDGTAAGTGIVADLLPGSDGSAPAGLVPFGGGIAFVANDGQTGFELWLSDGTAAGTRRVTDLLPGAGWGVSWWVPPAVVGGRLLFQGNDGRVGVELWISDGTAAGTVLLRDLYAGVLDSAPDQFTPLGNGRALFAASDPARGRALWVTDGTAGGTQNLGGNSLSPTLMTPDGTGGVFFAAGFALGVSDGTPAGTRLVTALGGTQPILMRAVGGTAFFTTSDNALWRSDGTVAGTVQLTRNVARPPAARELVAVRNNLAWFSDDSPAGDELWVTDGTPAGTRMAFDLEPAQPTASSNPEFVGRVAGRVIFAATESVRVDLYSSDGTAAGTASLGLQLGLDSATLSLLAEQGDYLLIAASTALGPRIVRTDGTPPGTWVLSAAHGSPALSDGAALDATRAVFAATMPNNPTPEVWVSDGTDAGTRMLVDLNGALSPRPAGFTRAGRFVYFAATERVIGHELWRTDGTTAGTLALGDLQPNPAAVVQPLGAAGDVLLFAADDGVHGLELWRTDGTLAGTRLLADLTPGPRSTQFNRANTAALGNLLIVSPRLDGADPRVLATDGNSFVMLPIPATASTLWWELGRAGSRVVALSVPTRRDVPRELFVTDGTVAGTRPLNVTLPAGDATRVDSLGTSAAVFALKPEGEATQVIRVDDGAAVTVTLLGTFGLPDWRLPWGPSRPMLAGGRLLAVGNDASHGRELWAVRPGPVAQIEGLGCGSRLRELSSTRPALGATMTLSVTGPAPATVIALGVPLALPLRSSALGVPCLSFVTAPSVLLPLPAQQTSLAIAIPSAWHLRGVVLEAQAIVGPTATGLDLSNGLRLHLDL